MYLLNQLSQLNHLHQIQARWSGMRFRPILHFPSGRGGGGLRDRGGEEVPGEGKRYRGRGGLVGGGGRAGVTLDAQSSLLYSVMAPHRKVLPVPFC
jgi:hypothetical protein